MSNIKRIYDKSNRLVIATTNKNGDKVELILNKSTNFEIYINGKYINTIQNNNDIENLIDNVINGGYLYLGNATIDTIPLQYGENNRVYYSIDCQASSETLVLDNFDGLVIPKLDVPTRYDIKWNGSSWNAFFNSELLSISQIISSHVIRGEVVVNLNNVTLKPGNYYFYSHNGVEYNKTIYEDTIFTLLSDWVLVFDLITKTFIAQIKTETTTNQIVLLIYDGTNGIVPSGVWSTDVLNKNVNSLMPYNNLALYNSTHVVRGSININVNVVTLSSGDYYFYDRNGNEYTKTIAETSFTLSPDWVLCFDLTSKIFIAQSKLLVNNNQIVLLLYDGVKGIVSSGLWATDILDSNIKSLTSRFDYFEANKLPSFVVNEANTTFKRLTNWIDGDDVFLVGQITDVHSSSTTKYIHIGYLAELQKIFGFNILWNGGDIGLDVGETVDATYSLLYNTKSQMQSTCPFIFTEGNHDSGTQVIPTKTINDVFNVPQKRQFPNIILNNSGYGYTDDSILKIRTYFLNTSDIATVGYGMSQTQLQWLADTIATLQSDWGVVILSHLCVDPIGRWTSYPTDADGPYFDTFRSIMVSLVAKTSGANPTSGVSWNFTSVPASVKLICSFAGDSHFNNSTVTNGINYIVRQGYGGINESEMPVGSTKDIFNYTSQCLFDVIAIKKDGTAKVFRIGAGGETRDLSFSY